MNSSIIVAVVIVLHALFLSLVRFFPYPELFIYPYFSVKGFLPYREIFDQHLPSLLMTPLNFYFLGLRSEFGARLFLIGSTTLSHFLIFLLSKKLFRNKILVFVPNLLFFLIQPLFEGNFLWIDTFLVPILLASFYFSLNFLDSEGSIDAFFSGSLLGVSLFFKQANLLLVLVVIIFVFWKVRSKKWIIFSFAGAVIPFFLTIVWILSRGIFDEFIYWTIKFNFEVYSKMAAKMPSFSQFARWMIVWLPALYWLMTNLRRKEFVLLLLFLVSSSIIVFPRFEFLHLQPALAFVVLSLSGFFLSNLKIKKGAVLALLSLLAIWWPVFLRKNFLKSSMLFTSDAFEIAREVRKMTKDDEKIFLLGTQPIVYYLSNRFPPGGVFSIIVPWNMKVVEETLWEALVSDPPKLVVRDSSATIDGRKVKEFTPKLSLYINENYRVIESIGTNEIMIPK